MLQANSRRRGPADPLLSGIVCLTMVLASGVAHAQTTPARPASGEATTPVEIIINVVNDQVQCRPPQLRLPASDRLELRVANRAAQPIMFVAPEFFKAAEHLESAGFVYDVAIGGFLAAPDSTVRALIVTPRPGEYYYSCYAPGRIPNPESSGFILVIPPAR